MSAQQPGAGAPTEQTTRTAEIPPPRASTDSSRSLGDIVGDIASDLSALVKQELELAKDEAKAEATRAGKAAGMFGGAGVAAHLMLIALTLTLVWTLDNWLPVEVAALILTAVWAVVAGVLALRGRAALRRMTPPMDKTQQTLKEDVQWAKAQRNG